MLAFVEQSLTVYQMAAFSSSGMSRRASILLVPTTPLNDTLLEIGAGSLARREGGRGDDWFSPIMR